MQDAVWEMQEKGEGRRSVGNAGGGAGEGQGGRQAACMQSCEAVRLQLLLQQPEVLPPLLRPFALHGDAPQPRRGPWTVREEMALAVVCRLRHRPQLEVTQREGL